MKGKKLKGFTLIELIVVLAIVAILTGLLTLNWIAYINDTKIKTANTQAKLIYNSSVTILQNYQIQGELGYLSGSVNGKAIANPSLVFTNNDGSGFANNVNTKLSGDIEGMWAINVNFNSASTPSAFTAAVSSVIYAETKESAFIGRFPNPIEQKQPVRYNETTLVSSGLLE